AASSGRYRSKGGGAAGSVSATMAGSTTSTPPGAAGFAVAAPDTCTTVSSGKSASADGAATTWASPARSRSTRKPTDLSNRRRCTHPASVTVCPACAGSCAERMRFIDHLRWSVPFGGAGEKGASRCHHTFTARLSGLIAVPRMGPQFTALRGLVQREGLHTVCQEAGCPNIYECWEDREATFLIGGDQCTRRCDFCQIDTGRPAEFDADEPRRVAESVATMGLRYATVTGVARDDLPDGGAWLYAETVRQIHKLLPGCGVELLIPDFDADPEQLGEVFGARPEVLAHNVETVPRIFKRIRPAFRYERSLDVLRRARAAGLVTKSNLILGLGEERAEVSQALRDLHDAGCELVTITQYLRPTPRHHPVERW